MDNRSIEKNKDESFEFNSNLVSAFQFSSSYNVLNMDTVKRWLKDPIVYNKQLRDTSRILYNSNGIYTNVIDYMVSLPTLDRVVYSVNKNHSRYKQNKQKFLLALRKMKDKSIARDILFKSAVDGTCFYYFETTEATQIPKYINNQDIQQLTEINANDFNCGAIPLPTDYCKIIGTRNSSYVIAFDHTYFDQFTGNGRSIRLKRYPKEIRDGYRAYRNDMNKRWQVLDNNKTITNKVRSRLEDAWGNPIGLATFIDMLYDEYFIDTKRSVLDEVNSTVIYQTFPEGEKKGQSSLTQKQQKDQHENIKNALFSKGVRKGINFFSVASGTKLDKLITNIDFLKVDGDNELIKRISTGLGFAGSSLNGQDGNYSSQQQNAELVSSEIFNWLEQIKEEFNKVINANIIKDRNVYMEVYYLPITHINRKNQFNYAKDLYLSAGGSLQYLIASAGVNPDAYLSLMDEEREEKFDEKYAPHLTSYTAKAEDKKAGRSENDNPTNPNTIKSKTTNSNANPRTT